MKKKLLALALCLSLLVAAAVPSTLATEPDEIVIESEYTSEETEQEAEQDYEEYEEPAEENDNSEDNAFDDAEEPVIIEGSDESVNDGEEPETEEFQDILEGMTVYDNGISVTGDLPADSTLQASIISDPLAVKAAPAKKSLKKASVEFESDYGSPDSASGRCYYDIKLLTDGEVYQPDAPVQITVSGLDVQQGYSVTITHYLDDADAIRTGLYNGTAFLVYDAEYVYAFPDSAAATFEATGEDAVCAEILRSSAGQIYVFNGGVQFVTSSFSIYEFSYQYGNYYVYKDDGEGKNSNGYSKNHEITMGQHNGNTYYVTRGQTVYLDVGSLYSAGTTHYRWSISDSSLGRLDETRISFLVGSNKLYTSSSAGLYNNYSVTAVATGEIWGNIVETYGTATIHIIPVPEITIHYDANGTGLTMPADKTTVYGDGVNVPYTFTSIEDLPAAPAGYVINWYDGSGNQVSSGNMLVLDHYDQKISNDLYKITIYCRVEPINYNITYELNDGTVTGNPTTYNAETETFTLKNPTREGYTFLGWTGSNGDTPQTTVTIPKGSSGDKSYTANWEQIPYSFDVNGYLDGHYLLHTYDFGSFDLYKNGTKIAEDVSDYWIHIDENPWYYGDTYEIKNITDLNGHTFIGIHTGGDYSGRPTERGISGTMPDEDLEIVLEFRTNESTLKVNPNGGTWKGSTSVKTYTEKCWTNTFKDDGTITMTRTTKEIPVPTRDGYTFKGWTKSKNFNGTLSSETDVATYTYGYADNVTDTITAEWEENKVTIDYVVVGPDGCGSVSPESEEVGVLTGEPSSTATANPTYKFVGWFIDEACKNPVPQDWVNGAKITPQKKDGKHVEATYYAKFELDVADLTIQKTINGTPYSSDDSFIFHVTGNGVDMYVTVKANQSVTIKALKIGTYTIAEETGWSWRYTCSEASKTITLGADKDKNKLTFINTLDDTKWLTGSASAVNTASTSGSR